MKIAAYCRVSTEKEAQIDSLEKQIEFFNEFTRKNGYELYKLYADEGISGKQIKHRKQFQQMMLDAKAKKFDKVVVKDVSRFARNTVDLLQSVRELKSYNVQVDFLNNGEVMEGGSEFILTILGAMAQQESANMSKRVKFGKDITAQKGRVPNIVFGYDKMPNERYILKINEEEAKLVKEIFESYVYKGWGTTKIAWDLNDRGIRTKRDKAKWVQNGIVRMLKNPIYTGRVTNKKSEVTDFITGTRKDIPEDEWIVVERPEMRIISDELFNKAQEILAQRSNEFKLNNKREKTEYVFSTLIYCKHCGYSFRRMRRKYSETGKEYVRWVCSGRNSMGVNHCPNTTVIDEEELLNAIKIYLKSIIKNKKNFMKAVEKEFEKITKLRENNERNEESLLQEIEKVTAKKRKYMEMFQNEVINIKELKQYTNPLNEDIARLERELKLITSEIKEKDVLEKELTKTIKTVDDILNNKTITNAMLKTIIDVIEVDSDSNVEVRLKLLNEIGSTPAVITNFNDIKDTVTESNISTNGGSGTDGQAQTFTYGVANQSFAAKNFSRTGYTQGKWAESSSGSGLYSITSGVADGWIESKYSNTDHRVDLYATWSVNSYTITFNGNGGSSSSYSRNYGTTLGSLPTPSRSGYNFLGWFTAASGGSQISTSTKVTGAATYYAHWQTAVVGVTTITKNTALGTTVNYTAGGGTWQVFYIDMANKFGDGAGSVYLKRKESIGNYKLSDHYQTSSNKIWSQNPTWHNYQSSISNANAKAVAYLTNTSNWSGYCDTNVASYAIGGPSVEMMQASSGQSLYGGCNATGYSLTYTSNALPTSLKNGMYNNGFNYWLASPNNNNSNNVCNLNANNSNVNNNNANNTNGVCPVDSLKNRVFKVPDILIPGSRFEKI